jgi:hypothetical protein
MARLMVGDRPPFTLTLWQLFFNTSYNTLCRLFKVFNRHMMSILTGCYDGTFVADVHDVCAAETRGKCRQFASVF